MSWRKGEVTGHAAKGTTLPV